MEIYAILDCDYEIQSQNRLDKYVSICSDSLAASKVLKTVRKVSFGSPVPKGVECCLYSAYDGIILGPRTCWNMSNEITFELARGGTAVRFLGPELALSLSR